MPSEKSPFRCWRERLGYTQAQAAAKMGMTITACWHYDIGHKTLRQTYILAMVAIERGFTADDLGKVNSD